MKIATFVVNRLMALWFIVLGLIAYYFPAPFSFLHPFTTYLLGLVILVMSLTLTFKSIGLVFQRPKPVIAGFLIKWITVPLFAYIMATLVYSKQPMLAAGTILDGAVPAGVSSNLFTFLGHGSVALAVSLSAIHTLLAPFLTPAITSVLASKWVPVSFMTLFEQLIEIIVVPVVLGVVIRAGLGEKRIQRAEPALPLISAIALYLITLSIVSGSSAAIHANLQWVPTVFGVTTVLIVANLAVAYFLARWLKVDDSQSRAIMFDVGVYNSGLGAGLAAVAFGPFAALPPMANMVMNLIIGALLAAVLQYYPVKQLPDAAVPKLVNA